MEGPSGVVDLTGLDGDGGIDEWLVLVVLLRKRLREDSNSTVEVDGSFQRVPFT